MGQFSMFICILQLQQNSYGEYISVNVFHILYFILGISYMLVRVMGMQGKDGPLVTNSIHFISLQWTLNC